MAIIGVINELSFGWISCCLFFECLVILFLVFVLLCFLYLLFGL